MDRRILALPVAGLLGIGGWLTLEGGASKAKDQPVHVAVSDSAVVSADSRDAAQGLADYEPGICPYPMTAEPVENGGQIIRPKVMSEYQPTLEAAAKQAAAPCFEDGADLYFRENPFGTYPGDTRAAVSDGSKCFQFGYSGGGDRWRISGQVQPCSPFSKNVG